MGTARTDPAPKSPENPNLGQITIEDLESINFPRILPEYTGGGETQFNSEFVPDKFHYLTLCLPELSILRTNDDDLNEISVNTFFLALRAVYLAESARRGIKQYGFFDRTQFNSELVEGKIPNLQISLEDYDEALRFVIDLLKSREVNGESSMEDVMLFIEEQEIEESTFNKLRKLATYSFTPFTLTDNKLEVLTREIIPSFNEENGDFTLEKNGKLKRVYRLMTLITARYLIQRKLRNDMHNPPINLSEEEHRGFFIDNVYKIIRSLTPTDMSSPSYHKMIYELKNIMILTAKALSEGQEE